MHFFIQCYIYYTMARPRRYEYPGGIYYISAGGRHPEDIFREESDRVRFLNILSETVFRFRLLCHSYCLMNDHYHLILETPFGNLSRGMRQVNGLYTQEFNRKYKRHGALFSGRFKSVIFEKARYLLPLNRHMMLNPVRAGLSHEPDDWPWSSYLPTIQKTHSPAFLFTRWILSRFSVKDLNLAVERYKHFIFSGRYEEKFSWRDLKFQVFLGSDFFIDKIRKVILMHKTVKRDKYHLREGNLRDFPDDAADKKRVSRRERDAWIYHAYIHQGYTLSEIADYLGIHYATVSRAVKRMERKLLR